MYDDDIFVFISVILIILFSLIIGAFLFGFNEDNDVYVNILANVTKKDVETTTSVVPVSNGKTTTMVSTTSKEYYILTDRGKIKVSHKEYNSININDTVVLTKNLNKSSLSYNCKIN